MIQVCYVGYERQTKSVEVMETGMIFFSGALILMLIGFCGAFDLNIQLDKKMRVKEDLE